MPSSASAFKGRHGQAVPLELGVVELGELPVAGPDDGLARVVDAVREGHAAVVVDAGDRLCKRERDALEGVVVVVEDDHAPGAAGAGAGVSARAFLRGRDRRRHDGASVSMTASAITRSGRPETWLAFR